VLEEAKKRRAAKGIKEEPPFDREEAQRIYEKYKAKQIQRKALQHAFLALFEPMASNGFRAVCPTIENCTVEAPTREEAKTALIGELKQRLRARLQAGETLPTEHGSAEMVEVALDEL
jgi:predicted RNase H-like HicB family nuclease